MNKNEIRNLLSMNPELKNKLFARGFLFTNDTVDFNKYPFFGTWIHHQFAEYSLLVSPEQNCFHVSENQVSFIIAGHAYNPFSMDFDESAIVSELKNRYSRQAISSLSSGFWKTIHELTGIFTIIIIDDNCVFVIGDACGIQTTFYTRNIGKIYVSSHTNIIGDLLDLHYNTYIQELKNYRFFKLFGNSLPGDLTTFKEVRRLLPNHYLQITADGNVKEKRFYLPHKLDRSEKEIAEQVAALMHSNMVLISRKWEKPGISLTGGCDSRTTLACANGLYHRFVCFSYISSDAEKIDAEAAKQICDAIGVKHKTYIIPDRDEDVRKAQEAAEIINWNTGDILYSNSNDVRKRIVMSGIEDFDVEVKSWVSEIGRAYYSKRFNNKMDFGRKPTARKCTTLYKVFLNNRKLVRETDQVFENYLKKHFQCSQINPVEWQEQFFWEFRMSSWNGLVITGEHKYSSDITIPYNNRRILELLLSASLDSRINDSVYKVVRDLMNPAIDETGISVTNLKHTKIRAMVENIYYILNNHFL